MKILMINGSPHPRGGTFPDSNRESPAGDPAGLLGLMERKDIDQHFCRAAYFSCSASSRARSASMRL